MPCPFLKCCAVESAKSLGNGQRLIDDIPAALGHIPCPVHLVLIIGIFASWGIRSAFVFHGFHTKLVVPVPRMTRLRLTFHGRCTSPTDYSQDMQEMRGMSLVTEVVRYLTGH